MVVDDASTDDTAFLAGRELKGAGEVLSGEFGGAGGARRAGLDRIVQMARERAVIDLAWLATTDADSRVPPGWTAAHLCWWRQGVEAVAGMVEPDWGPDTPPSLRRRYEEFMRALGTGYDHPHVYGANLGFTAEVYLRAGGMSTSRTGEDHAMWAALRAVGARIVSVPDDPVTTSSRRIGRAPSGFAALLASLAVE